MMRKSARCIVRLSLLVALVIGVAAGAWAWNPNDIPPINDDSIEVTPDHERNQRAYSSPMVVPAAAFHSDGGDADSHNFYFNYGYIAGDGDGSSTCMYAPLNVPAGATISWFYANVTDNNAGLDMTVFLRRVNKDTGYAEVMASVTSSGADSGIDVLFNLTITEPLVSWHFAYFVTTCVYDDFKLYNARVYYDEP